MADWRARAGAALIVTGAALLGCTVAGLTRCGDYDSLPPRPGERFDPALAAAARDVDALYAVADRAGDRPLRDLPAAHAMQILYEVVSARFTHGASDHSLPANWVAWAGGKLYAPLATIRNPDTVLRYGHSARCSEHSSVLIALARRAGLRVRQVWLWGHVVMEAWHDGAWHMYDVDLEVIPRGAGGAIASADELAADPTLTAYTYRDHHPDVMVDIFSTVDNNTVDDGPGPPRAVLAERVTEWLKWIVPAGLIAGGVLLRRRRT